MSLDLREYQFGAIDGLRAGFAEGHQAQMLYLATGGGKSLRKGTAVIMADGRVKCIEDVVVGDQLLGPDGTVRNVLDLGRGQEMMYEVRPTKGDPYYVNESHVLSLRKTGTKALQLADGRRIAPDADVVNVRLDVFLRSNKTARHCLKGWRSDAIEFHRHQDALPIDPYILGGWLGDGWSSGPTLYKPLCNLVLAWKAYGASLGLDTFEYKKDDDDCSAWRLAWPDARTLKPNPARTALQQLGLINNKHIPDAYKFSSVANRLRLIAGLLDSDGHQTKSGYDWISKCPRLASDFVFVCRSVGLAAYVAKCEKGIRDRGFAGTYFRVYVSGDCDRIPCLDKPAPKRRQKKRHLVTGLSFREIGVQDYYGVVLDGDHLFLLGDFTVTHNTEIAIEMMRAAEAKGTRTAMILDRIVLCDQTSKRLDKYKIPHGVMQAGHWRYRPHERIQVCSAQTLEKRGSFPGLSLLIVDEAHQTRKQTVEFIKAHPGIKVVGLSASPFTKGLAGIYSNVVNAATTEDLVKLGNLVPLRVFLCKQIDMTGAKKVAGEWSDAEASARGIKITGDLVTEWVAKTTQIFGGPRKTIVFCAGVAHGEDIVRKFAEAGHNFVSVSYKDDDEFKREVFEDFSRPDTKIRGLVATDILTKGFDCPDVMVGISARPFSKSLSSHVQQMGRVMRPHEGKSFALWLDHAGNYLRFADDWEQIYSEGVDHLEESKEKTKKEPTEREKKTATCPSCGAVFPPQNDVCAHCGHVRTRQNGVIVLPGEMEEYRQRERADKDSKQRFWSELVWIQRERGYRPGWAAHKYREKFGVWPRGLTDDAKSPMFDTLKWLQSRNIAWAKSRSA